VKGRKQKSGREDGRKEKKKKKGRKKGGGGGGIGRGKKDLEIVVSQVSQDGAPHH
jgi:hypothetical protein